MTENKTENTENNSNECCSEEWGILVSALVDGELAPEKAVQTEEHLLECPNCRDFARKLRKLKGVTSEMKLADLPDARWKIYKRGIYNRIEKRIGWIFTSIGAMILLAFGWYSIFKNFFSDSEISVFLKAGIAFVGLGLIILLVSAIREAWFRYQSDRYREVEI